MDEGLLSIIIAGSGQFVTFESHGIFGSKFAYLFILTFTTKRKKNIKKKYWSLMDSNHCASGCWLTRKRLEHSTAHSINLQMYLYILYLYSSD